MAAATGPAQVTAEASSAGHAEVDDLPRFGHPEVFAALAALSFAAARFLPLLALGTTCPFKAATGFPCATCGMTRALVALAHGEVGKALAVSPLGAAAAAAAWVFALLAGLRAILVLHRGRAWPWPRLSPRLARAGAVALLAALLANWAYLVVAHRA